MSRDLFVQHVESEFVTSSFSLEVYFPRVSLNGFYCRTQIVAVFRKVAESHFIILQKWPCPITGSPTINTCSLPFICLIMKVNDNEWKWNSRHLNKNDWKTLKKNDCEWKDFLLLSFCGKVRNEVGWIHKFESKFLNVDEDRMIFMMRGKGDNIHLNERSFFGTDVFSTTEFVNISPRFLFEFLQ